MDLILCFRSLQIYRKIPLHIKLDLMKQFAKVLPKEGEYFKYLYEEFLGLSEAKLKEEVFLESGIRKLMKNENFEFKRETTREKEEIFVTSIN
ncbi:hypothetical protein AVEN_103227-1 [Araneus ventricosus]|uniref:Uncharacterized protein n=1 Tax=Araneus ventricosus TaxID=182803 RepID=A0A4Y2F8Y6_ARAVE|nr:hypothetical protein AVEN_103227-1 [Araneus ventricosus]